MEIGDKTQIATSLLAARFHNIGLVTVGTTLGMMLANGGERKQAPVPRYRVLRPEDEAEVERLYQRLKTVGNLDQKNSTDEK